MAKRKKLEEEGKDLSQLDVEIGISTEQKEYDWKRVEETAMSDYKLGDLSTVQSADPKSLRYMLDRKLILLVKQKLGQRTSPWMLPQLKNSGEPLRQVSSRFVRSLTRSSLDS